MRRRYSNGKSSGWIDVFSTSSWWQTGGAVKPWKCRLVDTGVIVPLLQGSAAFFAVQIGAAPGAGVPDGSTSGFAAA